MMGIFSLGLSWVLVVLLSGVKWWHSVGVLTLMLVFFVSNLISECFTLFKGTEIFMDFWGYSLGVISLWVVVLSILASQKIGGSYMSKWLEALVLILLLILLGSFSMSNLLGFYLYFESSLIPMFLIILGFGYQPERLQAGLYFIFYTLGASLPLLFMVVFLYFEEGGVSMLGVTGFMVSGSWGSASVLILGAFLVSMPMVFTHLWLPKAHVEAPVSGSMILAGVLLKLGGYGLGRLGGLVTLFSGLGVYIIGLSLVGMVYVSLICCQMNDLKALIAYSSVAHMGLVLGGLFSGLKWGALGSLIMMVGHGVSSSGLFFMANIYYDRSFSRSMFINKGLMGVLPVGSLMFFMLCSGNMSVPPTINFWSEIYLMGSILGFDTMVMMVFPIGSFLGVVFTMLMYSYTQHGKMVVTIYSTVTLVGREILVMLLHVLPLYFLFLKMDVLFI